MKLITNNLLFSLVRADILVAIVAILLVSNWNYRESDRFTAIIIQMDNMFHH